MIGRDERLGVLAGGFALAAVASGRPLAPAIGSLVAAALTVSRFRRAARHPSRAMRAWGTAGVALSLGAVGATLGVVASIGTSAASPGASATRAITLLFVAALAAVDAGSRRARLAWRAAPRKREATLSVGILCFNEADRLPACLDALRGWPDEIVVLDSGSTDGTVEVARATTDAVFVTDWPGDGPQKQRLLERCRSDWFLLLDADEVATEEFRRDVDAAIASRERYVAYDFPWVHVAFDGDVYFGAVGHRFTRLFRRREVRFGHETLHAVPIVSGDIGSLDGPVFHHSYRDFAHLMRKHEEYAWTAARARHGRGARVTAVGVALRSAVAFVSAYVVKLGVLDGARGLLLAAVHATYTFDKYAALWSLSRDGRR